MPTSVARKIRQVLCCESGDVDQNEGPPPSSAAAGQQIAPQLAQSAAETNAGVLGEEQPDPIEEDWGDEEPAPNPYKLEDFVVEESDYSKYNYDPSPFKGFEDVQKAFNQTVQDFDKNKPAPVDLTTIWGNPEYERSIRYWNSSDQESSANPIRRQATAR